MPRSELKEYGINKVQGSVRGLPRPTSISAPISVDLG